LVDDDLTFTSLELGDRHSCGLVDGGKAYCWGRDGWSEQSVPSPQEVVSDIAFTQLAAGGAHTCGITSTGVAYCWGSNGDGALGIGAKSPPSSSEPILVAGGRTFSAISAGTGNHTCAVPVGGGPPFCWGYNDNGQLGNGTTADAALPVEVLTPPVP
jgi:alpha-tubulin suppressor-like RCC1 family protein